MLLTGNGIFRGEILEFSHNDFACLMLISLCGFPRMKRNWLIVFLRKLPCWSVNALFDPQGFDRTPNPKRDHNPWEGGGDKCCHMCMCRCEGDGFQAVYYGIGYRNQRVRVKNRVSFSRKLINWLKI